MKIRLTVNDNESVAVVLPPEVAATLAGVLAQADVYERDGYYSHSGWKTAEKGIRLDFTNGDEFKPLDPRVKEANENAERQQSKWYDEYRKREEAEKERDKLKAALEAVQQFLPQAKPEVCESGDPECGPVEHHDSEGVPLCQACWEGLVADSAGEQAQQEGQPE